MTISANALAAMIAVAALIGIALGVGLSSSRWRRRHAEMQAEIMRLTAQLSTEAALAGERAAALTHAEERLAATFSRLAGESLASNSDNFLRLARENLSVHQERAKTEITEREKAVAALVAPIREALDKTAQQIAEIEKDRHTAFGGIRAQLAAMNVDQQTLQLETRNLVNALRRPQVRGRWGELTLRRVVELAGMVEHCDFIEQETIAGSDSSIRPDMIVRLPDRAELVVDVKTPLDAYLEAMEASTDQDRKTALQRHARNVADRVRELSAKAYWSQFPTSPEFVILFIPGDHFLSAALSENPDLMEDALRNKVVLTTPANLVALLRTIAYGWRQLSLERNAEEIRRLGQELYERLMPFTAHLAKLGRQIKGSVETFNEAVGSLERKVLPGARKLVELGIRGRQNLESPEQIESAPRDVVAIPPESAVPGPDEEAAGGDAEDLSRAH